MNYRPPRSVWTSERPREPRGCDHPPAATGPRVCRRSPSRESCGKIPELDSQSTENRLNLLLQDQLLISSQFESVNVFAMTDQQLGLASKKLFRGDFSDGRFSARLGWLAFVRHRDSLSRISGDRGRVPEFQVSKNCWTVRIEKPQPAFIVPIVLRVNLNCKFDAIGSQHRIRSPATSDELLLAPICDVRKSSRLEAP